jgi:uncharacterized membrane protein
MGTTLKKITLIFIILQLSTFNIALGQNITPKSLELRIYPDGSTLVEYFIDVEPSEVRVDVELFGDTIHNLIIKDEENNPLDYSETPSGITIDSIGASEITIIYYTYDLTSKEGPLWDLNITSQLNTAIFLPENAAIFDLSDIPLSMEVMAGQQYIELPPGELYVSYIISVPDLMGEAEKTLEAVDEYIQSLEEQTYIVRDARNEYQEAVILFQNNQFSEAKEKALQAQETADNTVDVADSAIQEMTTTEAIINQAIEQERTLGLSQAQEALSTAEDYYSQGDYRDAETYAKQAYQLALSATTTEGDSSLIYIAAFLVILVSASAYFYTKRVKKPTQTARAIKSNDKRVDLERIFDKHDTLKLEDREVIKYLAENNGEVFATEIRNRFDMPRSTAWRLIRRLKELEIVEEIKVGNQSLIRIKEEYHA